MPTKNIDAAQERARERMREWFAERDRPFKITKHSHHGTAWVLLFAIVCAGTLLGNHMPPQTLSSIHSALGI